MTFRPGLLTARHFAVLGLSAALADQLRRLGATVTVLDPAVLADDETATQWARDQAPLQGLVVDAGAAFAGGGIDGIQAALDQSWRAARAVAVGALIDGGEGGRLLFVAPRAGAAPHAEAVAAALENLARTLSIEWARFGVTTVALAPGPDGAETALTALVTFLLSPAGGYFSGCRLQVGGHTGFL